MFCGAVMNTKPSATLRYLETHEVFTLGEYLAEVDSSVGERVRYLNLLNAVRRGQAYSLKRRLYASNIGAYRDSVPNVMLVAAKAAPDSVVAYHAALEAHGVAHSPARSVYFVSPQKVAPFEVRGYRFRRAPDLEKGRSRATWQADRTERSRFVTQLRYRDAVVPATSRERTLVDCLYRLDLAGGLEEFMRSIGSFSTMLAADVADYVCSLSSPTLIARAGWLLDLMRDDWLVDPAPLEDMRGRLGRGTYWLQRRRPEVDYEFVSEWRLYVPAALPYQDWLRG